MILGQIVHSQPALERLAETPLKAAIAYRLRLLLQQTRPLLAAYEETRVALVREMGEATADGTGHQVKPENLDLFQQQMEPMLSEPVTLNFKPLGIDDLGDTAVTATDLLALDWLFGDESTPESEREGPKAK